MGVRGYTIPLASILFLPFKKRQTYCKGAQQACTVMLSFPLKQHVLCCKYNPQLVLITPSC